MDDFFDADDLEAVLHMPVHTTRYLRTLDPDNPKYLKAVMVDGRYHFAVGDVREWLQRPSQRLHREALLAAFVPDHIRDQISQLRRKPVSASLDQMVAAWLPQTQPKPETTQ